MQNPAMKKAVMKKAPQKKAPETPTIPEYNDKLKKLDDKDAPLDRYWDLESENAKDMTRKESRKRVARALMAAAAALDGAYFSNDDLEDALSGILEDVARAVQFAKHKQFAKSQTALEIAMAAAKAMVEDDVFRDADLSEEAEAEAGSGHPSWAR